MQFAFTLVLISILISLSHSAKEVRLSWAKCGDASDAVQVEAIDFHPPNPREGTSTTISIEGIVKDSFFKESTGTLSVYIDGKQHLSKTSDICDLRPTLFPKECPPTKLGPFSVWYSLSIPDVSTISGKFKYEWRGNHGSARLFCYSITLEIPL